MTKIDPRSIPRPPSGQLPPVAIPPYGGPSPAGIPISWLQGILGMPHIVVPPGGFAGYAQMTPASQALFARFGRIGGRTTQRRRRRAKASAPRRRRRTRNVRKSRVASRRRRARLVKGSAAAKRYMARIRKMRRR